MKRSVLKQAAHVILGLMVIGYLAVAATAYINQRDMMYHPERDMKAPQAYKNLSMAEFSIAADDGVKLSLWYRPANPGEPTLVFFHGNAGHLGTRADKFRAIIDSDLGLLAVSYRGFGSSEGTPSEEGIYKDARAALAWLEQKGVKREDVILYGESLGSAVAVQMATEFQEARALVLEAPFASMASMGRMLYPYLPVSLLLKDRFDSIGKIKDSRVPLLIVHGDKDAMVPVEQGKKLFETASEPKRLELVPGLGHDNMPMATIIVYTKTFLATKGSGLKDTGKVGAYIRAQKPGELPPPGQTPKLELKIERKEKQP